MVYVYDLFGCVLYELMFCVVVLFIRVVIGFVVLLVLGVDGIENVGGVVIVEG